MEKARLRRAFSCRRRQMAAARTAVRMCPGLATVTGVAFFDLSPLVLLESRVRCLSGLTHVLGGAPTPSAVARRSGIRARLLVELDHVNDPRPIGAAVFVVVLGHHLRLTGSDRGHEREEQLPTME